MKKLLLLLLIPAACFGQQIIPLSQLPVATNTTGPDIYYVVQNGVSMAIGYSNLLGTAGSSYYNVAISNLVPALITPGANVSISTNGSGQIIINLSGISNAISAYTAFRSFQNFYHPLMGTNDDTTKFQQALYDGVPVFVEANTNYSCGNLYLTNGSFLASSGATINYLTNATGSMFYLASGVSNAVLRGLTLNGQKYSFLNAGLPYGLNGSYVVFKETSADRTGITANCFSSGSDFGGNIIEGFSTSGITFYGDEGSAPQPQVAQTRADNITILSSWQGIVWTNSAEYMVIRGAVVHGCGISLDVGAGNTYVNSAIIEGNCVGANIRGLGEANNPAHGLISDSSFNHNDIFFKAQNFFQGFFMINCCVLGGGPSGGQNVTLITNCTGVVFQNVNSLGVVGSAPMVTVDGGAGNNSGPNWIRDAYFQPGAPTILVTNSGVLNYQSLIYTAGGNQITTNSEPLALLAGTNSIYGKLRLGSSIEVATNALSLWPTAPSTPGAFSIVSSNGVVYLLTSGLGSTWTGTNKIAP